MENNENVEFTNVEEITDKNFDMTLQVFDKANISIDKLNNSISLIGDIAKDTGKFFVTIKEIDKDIKNIDAEMQIFLKKADNNLEKFKTKAVIVEKLLNNFSNKLDVMLNKAMSIDTGSEKTQEIELRTQLLSQVKDWGDTMSSILIKLLAS